VVEGVALGNACVALHELRLALAEILDGGDVDLAVVRHGEIRKRKKLGSWLVVITTHELPRSEDLELADQTLVAGTREAVGAGGAFVKTVATNVREALLLALHEADDMELAAAIAAEVGV